MKVWMLCEAFTLTADASEIRESLTPWCIPCESRNAAMRRLRECVKDRVSENYEGVDNVDEAVRSDIREVLGNPLRLGRGIWRYSYSAGDREVVWRVYPCEVTR